MSLSNPPSNAPQTNTDIDEILDNLWDDAIRLNVGSAYTPSKVTCAKAKAALLDWRDREIIKEAELAAEVMRENSSDMILAHKKQLDRIVALKSEVAEKDLTSPSD